jgi:GTP pyrophosphokinase
VYTDIKKYVALIIEQGEGLNSIQVLSQYAHRGQTRRTGKPYFFHPQEVANIIKKYYNDDVTYYTALLHDALEDGIPLGNIDNEQQFFDLLVNELPDSDVAIIDEIYTAVSVLTKGDGLVYNEYVVGLLENVSAFRVKLADIMQNITDSPTEKQVKKYVNIEKLLLKMFNDEVPTGISKKHWNDFQKVVRLAENK